MNAHELACLHETRGAGPAGNWSNGVNLVFYTGIACTVHVNREIAYLATFGSDSAIIFIKRESDI
jgi:hypothetical protein